MVALDRSALQNVRVNRPLREELDVVELPGLFLKDANEFADDHLAFLFRIGDADEFVEEAVGRIHVDQVRVQLLAENLDHLFGFAFAQKPVVDMHADQLPTHGLDQKGRDDGGIDAAGKGEQNLLRSDLLPQGFQLFVNERLRKRGRCDSFHVVRTFIRCHFSTLLMWVWKSSLVYAKTSPHQDKTHCIFATYAAY